VYDSISSHKRFKFSLSTKFILFAIFIEVLLMAGGFYIAYTFLSQQRILHVQSMLASQVNLLAKEIELKNGDFSSFSLTSLELNSNATFQVVDLEGRVLIDSKYPNRLQTKISGPHPLLNLARAGTENNHNLSFLAPLGNESFFGAYRRVSNQYVVMGAIAKDEVYRDTYFILEKLLQIGSLLSGIAILLIAFYSSRIIRPIRRLTYAARQIAGGNFDFEIESSSNDEIGLLSDSFSSMSKQVKVLLQEEIKKARMQEELSNVASIQQSLLPKPHLKTERYEIQSFYRSAAETGGDYWGYFELDQHLVVYIADATGHGLTSAMLTVAARGCFSALHRLMSKTSELAPLPSTFLTYANDAVLESAQEELNMTMFVAVYSYQNQTLTYANAGHNAAWIIRDHDGQKRIEVLKSSGVRLGESKVYVAPEDKVVSMSAKDAIFLYTDGMIDCENVADEQYGKNRVKDLLARAMQESNDLKSIRDQLVNDITEFIGDRALADDITFAVVKPL
jgi:serine phosphatase RsbU (regulator of sigma subunit)